MKCTDHLGKDHHIILRAVDVLEQIGDEVKKGAVDPLVRFLKEFEDGHHKARCFRSF